MIGKFSAILIAVCDFGLGVLFALYGLFLCTALFLSPSDIIGTMLRRLH